MVAQVLPIGIVRDPVSARETGVDGAFQSVARALFVSHDRKCAGGVIQDCVVIGG
jgi:hypothetical protein